MKSMNIESWVDVRRLTPGRRSYSMLRMKESPHVAAVTGLAAACDAVMSAEAYQLELQRRYASTKGLPSGVWSPELVRQDVVLDRLVSELRDLLAAVTLRVGSVRGKAAKALLEELFAQGVPYYTQVAFEDEAARVGELVRALAARMDVVRTATADEVVVELTAVHDKYAALLASTQRAERVGFDEVKSLDLTNHRRFLKVIGRVLGHASTLEGAAEQAFLKDLLTIVAEQDADVAAQIRAKRRVKDVNPTTGEVVETDETD